VLCVVQLALKHRINKRQEQRVIAFVASPVSETIQELTTLGTRMKKNKVAIDIVAFGENAQNEEKLQAFVTAANSGDNSHYLAVQTKPYVVLTDELAGSPVFGAAMSMGGGAMDDDLEMAIRLSLQEQGGGAGAAPAPGAVPAAPGAGNAMAVDDEDAMMAQAIAMSMGGAAPQSGGPGAAAGQGAADIDEDMELAIRLSMQDNMDVDTHVTTPATSTTTSSSSTDTKPASTEKPAENAEADPTQDPEFLRSLIQNLDGVDPNDPNFKELLASLGPDALKDKGEKKDEHKKPEDK